MQYVDPKETYYHKILNLNEDSPYYYIHLIQYAKMLLAENDIEQLEEMIEEIELVVGGDLRAILVAINNNDNPNAFFKEFVRMEDGTHKEFRISRHEIIVKFDETRTLILGKMRDMENTIRFSKVPTSAPI